MGNNSPFSFSFLPSDLFDETKSIERDGKSLMCQESLRLNT